MIKSTTIALTAFVFAVCLALGSAGVNAQTYGNLTPSSMYTGTLYNTSSGGTAVTTPTNGSIYYTTSGSPVYYSNGSAYNAADTSAGTPILQNGVTPTTNGTYYSTTGVPLYYYNGSYFYPNTSTGGTSGGTSGGTTGNTGTGGTSVTPGVPNTGAGGSSAVNWAILLASGLVAVGGVTYLARRVA
ncbi:MAG: hypothetical protein V4481_04245 [Patescibacteria group bacterium]